MFDKFSQFRPLHKEVWRIPAIYFAVSGAWILLSDTLLGALPLPLDELVWFSAAKGMAFVAFTTLLLFLLIRRAYRKQLKLEWANQQSEQFLREMLLASPAVCYRLRNREQGVVLDWISDNSKRILGYRAAQIPDIDSWLALIHPDDQVRVRQVVAETSKTRRYRQEYRVRHADGRYLWVYDELCLSDIQQGDRCYVGAIIDISEQRQVQERLRLNSAVIESIHNGVVITDPNGAIEWVNSAFTTITGYSEAEVKGKNPHLLSSGHHEREFFTHMWHAVAEEGFWAGEIMNRRRNGELYVEWLTVSRLLDERGKVTHYIGTFSDISRLKSTEARVQQLENFDPVSKLPNRKGLLQQMTPAIEEGVKNGSLLAVLCLDIIDFKKVNDSFGHPVGDKVIREIAHRLRQRLRDRDGICRASGDKFVIFLNQLANPGGVDIVTKDLLAIMSQPVSFTGLMDIYLDVVIGITLFPQDGEDSETLLRNAEAASNHAKFRGRNLACYYSTDMTTVVSRKIELEGRLRQALQHQEFVLHYQPVVCMSSGRMVGAEALIRWQPPGEKMIAPGEFIPLAEETGLIVPMGEWILRDVARQLKAWLDAGLDPGVVAVNLSARQMAQENLVDVLRDVITQHAIPPALIELEITETSLMSDADAALGILNTLRTTGCKIAIDDFGTGYSSLAYLKRFPIDKIKIDRSFVMDLQESRNGEIVHAIISMAKALRLDVQAEGVETPEQRQWLQGMNCDTYQGYLFSRPLPVDSFEAMLRGDNA